MAGIGGQLGGGGVCGDRGDGPCRGIANSSTLGLPALHKRICHINFIQFLGSNS